MKTYIAYFDETGDDAFVSRVLATLRSSGRLNLKTNEKTNMVL